MVNITPYGRNDSTNNGDILDPADTLSLGTTVVSIVNGGTGAITAQGAAINLHTAYSITATVTIVGVFI